MGFAGKIKWLKNKHRTLGNCPPTGIKRKKQPVNKPYWVISKIALGIYYIAFLTISFIVGMEAHAEHHGWIVADALNGFTGGVLLVYPFNIFRMDLADTLDNWLKYTILMFFLTGTAMMVGNLLRLGGFI